jgi:prepilin-type N-terminal cleavage/methylation domain-containing protein
MRARSCHNGFTLPETLVAVTILSLVILIVYSSWATLLRATESSAGAAESTQRERVAIAAIKEVLAGASWYESQPEGPLALETDEAFSRLKIVARVPPGFWGGRTLENFPLRRIEFLTEPCGSGKGHQLVMEQQPLPSDAGSGQIHRTVLLPKIEEFSIEVQAARAANSGQWESVWGLTNMAPKGMPVRARVSLGAMKKFPRRLQFPVFASLASHANATPGIGTVTNISGITFETFGFNIPQDDDARLVFLIDKSGSMRGGQLEMAKRALFTSLEAMAGKGNFYVYFFTGASDAMRLEGIRSPVMLEANAANIAKVTEWIDSRKAGGGTNPSDSLKSAFTHKPTHLFLLTDGEFRVRKGDPKVGELIQSLNSSKEAKINTLAVGDPLRGTPAEAGLMIIAAENEGTYTFIDPLAASFDSLFSAPSAPPSTGPTPTTKNP